MTVSRENIQKQLEPEAHNSRKEWLKYKVIYIKLHLEQEPSTHAFLSFKRTARLYEELREAYLNEKYLTTIILCGAFAEKYEIELQNSIIELIEKKLSAGIPEKEIIAFFETQTNKRISENALSPADFVMRFKPKGKRSGFLNAEHRKLFLKELVRWNIISESVKGALNEIKKYRDQQVHGNFEAIISRYEKDKFEPLFGARKKQRKKEMLDLLTRAEVDNHMWMFEEELQQYKERTKEYEKIADAYWTLPCQTAIDFVECIADLKKLVEEDRLGILMVEE